jgi:hypothetical protein
VIDRNMTDGCDDASANLSMRCESDDENGKYISSRPIRMSTAVAAHSSNRLQVVMTAHPDACNQAVKMHLPVISMAFVLHRFPDADRVV